MASKADTGAVPGRTPEDRGALLALSMAMLLASLGTSIANVALPALGTAFGAPLDQLQWVVLSYLAAVTGGVLFAGRLGDELGRRTLLLAGLALFFASSLLCAAAPALWGLVAARAGQGLGAAAMMALAMALAVEAPGKSGRALGLLGAMSAAGTALGPALGGVLIALAGWRALFLLCACGGGAALVLVLRYVPGREGAVAARGGFRAMFALARDPLLARSLAALPLGAAVVMAALVVGPFYLAYGLEQNAARVGLLLSIGPVVAALAGVPAGRLADRFGARRVTVAGLLLMAGGSAGLGLFPLSFGVAGYAAPIAVTTFGYALFQTGNNGLVLRRAPGGQRGLVSGLLTLLRNAGLIAGASAGAYVFAFMLGSTAPAVAAPGTVAAAARAAFGASALLPLLALAVIGIGGWMPDEDSNLD